jgi:multimeric flavodoxin WrbA/ketosteroid isomerase-like protein
MSSQRPSIAIVYDSGSRGNPALRGRTEVVARTVAAGAQSVPRTRVTLIRATDPNRRWPILDAADAIVLGCPTYMGSASAALKAFMEESLHPRWTEQRWKDKLAAGFTNSAGMSGDKLLTLQQLAGFAAQHGMLWLSLGQPPGWQDAAGSAEDRNRLASFLGLMTQSNSDQGPAEAPPASDRETARWFGKRIALATRRWTAQVGADHAVRTVLDAFAAVEQRNRARPEALHHAQAEFHWPPSLAASRPGQTWHDIWDRLQPSDEERSMSPRVIAATDREVVVLWRQRGVGANGERLDAEVIGLYEVRDSKLVRAQMFYFDTTAILRFLDHADTLQELTCTPLAST